MSRSSSTAARRTCFRTTGSGSASTIRGVRRRPLAFAPGPRTASSKGLPDEIGPQAFVDGAYRALFPAFDRREVELPPGGRLLLEFEGDLWETEDHRNWTDANFKTYSTPIALGPPAPLQAGQQLRQRLVVTPLDVPCAASKPGPIQLSVGAPTGTRVPPIGLGADRDGLRACGS